FMWTFNLRMREMEQGPALRMSLSNRCNNRCSFCAAIRRPPADGDLMAQKAGLLEHRRRGVVALQFGGGEPTMSPNLIRLIRFARKIGYQRIRVTTNGRMCAYEGYARKLLGSGLTSLRFSIHGSTPQMHAQSVGAREAFEQTLAGVDRCVEGLPAGIELGASVTLTRSNHEHLLEIAALIHAHGLRRLDLHFLTPFGGEAEAIRPDPERAIAHCREAIDTWKDRLHLRIHDLPFCRMPGYETYLEGDRGLLEAPRIDVGEASASPEPKAQRRIEPGCEGCPHRCFCGGFRWPQEGSSAASSLRGY
ncbi:MAG: radical SAM protein, partial [Myxococcales bacterium]|nr:radical SAM protein [Myxococcales bacterium]